jgi:RNA polymerase sigma-70 factor, ECF subfamily
VILSNAPVSKALLAIHRREGGKILAGLIRYLNDFDRAEEALQEAYTEALDRWLRDGLPDNPAAWLTTVAKHRALDVVRRDMKTAANSEDVLDALPAAEAANDGDDDAAIANSGVVDDQLRLIFTCCHPALAPSAQAALALRTLCGLSTREIARAFVEPETTTAQKIVRAKRKIAGAKIPYEIPTADALPERLGVVLAVIYLVFNEGYSATADDALIRRELCREAIRLGDLVTALMPDQAEALGLLALMRLHDARRDARADAEGALIPLEEQDRSLWNRDAIDEATKLLDCALLLRQPGPYQIQAAIAALHANARVASETDWTQISFLYGALLRHTPTLVVELNAAVAVAMAANIPEGLNWIDRIAARGGLEDYHLLHAARADLLRRAHRFAESAGAYRKAIALVTNKAEAAYLERRLAEVSK